jgi:hypothetical protein
MTNEQVVVATIAWAVIITVVYHHCTWSAIKNCYRIWLDRTYWTNYNIIDAVSWVAKAVIIIPALIFGLQIWWLYFIALLTSMALIWASEKKLLPTMVGFNTLWIWLSCMVLAQHLVN